MDWNKTIAWICIASGCAVFGLGYGVMLGAGMTGGICQHSAALCNKTEILRQLSPIYYFCLGFSVLLLLVGIIMLCILSGRSGELIRKWLKGGFSAKGGSR